VKERSAASPAIQVHGQRDSGGRPLAQDSHAWRRHAAC
jgi:hypothetical protein